MTGVPVSAARVPFVSDPDFTLYVGDVREVLRELPDESVQMCVTSPPYWGLRDYGAEGQLGLERTPDEYVVAMVGVFSEVRRVLRRDGTLWLNIGDSYVSDPGKGGSGTPNGRNNRGEGYARERMAQVKDGKAVHGDVLRPFAIDGLAPKNLIGIPWRLAFALQADGWYLRSDIIWSKPNPMPESVTDRPTKAHEYLFLLSKSPHYFYDAEAIREPYNYDGRSVTHVEGRDGSAQHRNGERWPNGGRNKRSVWEVATKPYADAHFATFPPALVEPCVKAGSGDYGCCPECGAPWVRQVEVESSWRSRSEHGAIRGNLAPEGFVGAGTQRAVHGAGVSHDLNSLRRVENGWKPACDHDHGSDRCAPCVVLDPFMGSGTTALVARKLSRKSIGIELNEDYAKLAARRLSQLSLFAEDTV